MYVPTAFGMEPDDVRQFVLGHGAADLVTRGRGGLSASLIPFVYEPSLGPHGVLRGHLARNNPQWQDQWETEALVIIRGPDSYVSPSWYASKQEHGRVVPTWNYVTAHLHGPLTVHDDIEFVRRVVEDLTVKHEAGREHPWAVADAPAQYIEGQLRAVVGIEIAVSRIVAKAKVSQNRSDADIDGVVRGLEGLGERDMAAHVEGRRPDRR